MVLLNRARWDTVKKIYNLLQRHLQFRGFFMKAGLQISSASQVVNFRNKIHLSWCQSVGHKPKINFIFIGSFSASTAWINDRTNSDPKLNNWFRRFLSLSRYSKMWKIILRSVTIWDWTWIWVKNARNNWHRSFSFKFSKRKIESPPGKKKQIWYFI